MPEDQQDGEWKLSNSERFGMYNTLLSVCQYDYDKMLLWMNRDIEHLFKYLAYMKVKSLEDNAENKNN
jgi:hypothetical protein